MIYIGKQDPMAGLGHAQTVVMDLIDDLLGCYLTGVTDNYFTNISLAKHLLQNDTYLIGTLKSSRAGLGHEIVQKKLRRGEVYEVQNKNGIKLIKWKDKRDIMMIFTKLSHSTTLVDTRKTNKLNECIVRPQVVLDYNTGK